jgi:hypothetical protein
MTAVPLLPLALLIVVLTAQAGNGSLQAFFDAYVRALGGEAALRAVGTRTTEGRFDNGGGLRTAFRTLEKAPNKRVTIIGSEPRPTGHPARRPAYGVVILRPLSGRGGPTSGPDMERVLRMGQA